jgi:hypothetical protein
MPATFPAHPAAVLSLKLWRPAWFDGVALTLGSMAPDLAYTLDGSWLERPFPGIPPLWQLAHSLPWFLAWALPVTLLLCALIRFSAPSLAAHLPALSTHPNGPVPVAPRRPSTVDVSQHRPLDDALRPPTFAVPALDVSRLPTPPPTAPDALPPDAPLRTPASGPGASGLPAGAVRSPESSPSAPASGSDALRVSARAEGSGLSVPSGPTSPRGSASRGLVGALFGFSLALSGSLRGLAFLGRGPRWYVTASSAGIGALSHVLWDRIAVGPLDLASSLVGGLFCFWLLYRLARRHSSTPPAARPRWGGARRPVAFWGAVVTVFAVGGALLPHLAGYFLPHTSSARVILLAMAAVGIGAAATARAGSRLGEPLQQ